MGFTPVELWTPVAALEGLRGDSFFAGGIWRLISHVTSHFGFVLPQWVYLWPLSLLVVYAVWRYFKTQRHGWLLAAFFLGGVILADTPYVVLIAVAAAVVRHVMRRRDRAHGDEKPGAEIEREVLGPSFALVLVHLMMGFALLAGPNAIIYGATTYAAGYVTSAARATGLFSDFSAEHRAASSILSDYVEMVAGLASGGKWLFTDGFCDDGIRLALAKKGEKVEIVPLVGGTSADLKRLGEIFSGEEQTAFETSPSVLLKTWLEKKSPELDASRFLVNPGIWRLYGREDPKPMDIPESFAERVLHFYELGYRPQSLNLDIRRKFVALHWRLSRVFRDKAHWLDRSGDVHGAEAAMQLVDRLDRADDYMRRELERLDRLELLALCAATPREGMRFALRNLNYRLASRLARPILADNPDDPEANFAMAMESATLGNFSLAEVHLSRAIKTNPKEPALQNNMAKVLLELGRAREALRFAEEAAKLAPNSTQVRDTLKAVRDAQPVEE